MINVDEMGMVTYPKGVEVNRLGVKSLVGVAPKVISIGDKLFGID